MKFRFFVTTPFPIVAKFCVRGGSVVYCTIPNFTLIIYNTIAPGDKKPANSIKNKYAIIRCSCIHPFDRLWPYFVCKSRPPVYMWDIVHKKTVPRTHKFDLNWSIVWPYGLKPPNLVELGWECQITGISKENT